MDRTALTMTSVTAHGYDLRHSSLFSRLSVQPVLLCSLDTLGLYPQPEL